MASCEANSCGVLFQPETLMPNFVCKVRATQNISSAKAIQLGFIGAQDEI